MILEFFIMFFGIIWLVLNRLGTNASISRARDGQDSFNSRSLDFQRMYGATQNECKIAEWVIRFGVAYDPVTFKSTLDMYFCGDSFTDKQNRVIFSEIQSYPGLSSKNFVSLIRDDVNYIFGYGSHVITNNKYTPEKDIHFVQFDEYKNWRPVHGPYLMKMLVLAKMGKIPPYPKYGSTRGVETADDVEMRFLERIEWSLRENGVPASFVLTSQHGSNRIFHHKQDTACNTGVRVW